MEQFAKDRLTIRIHKDRATLGVAAARAIADSVCEGLVRREYVNMIFAAAPSQQEMLASLIHESIDWSRINAFHMDEYIGLPPDAPQSFRHFLDHHLFSRVAFREVHYINGGTRDLTAECSRYTDLLQAYPPDVVCMGIGENGHIAFNDPHVADFADPQFVKLVDLDEPCRQQQVNDGCFETIEQVPARALTLTIPALLRAREIFCVVPGKKKAAAVRNTLEQAVDPKFPSTILRTHPAAILFVDEDSYPVI